jgi:hypothetical protein
MWSKTSRRRVVNGRAQGAAECAVTERYEALLRVSRNLISIRSSEELFRLLARELRAVVKFYVMGVGIYDASAHQMHHNLQRTFSTHSNLPPLLSPNMTAATAIAASRNRHRLLSGSACPCRLHCTCCYYSGSRTVALCGSYFDYGASTRCSASATHSPWRRM